MAIEITEFANVSISVSPTGVQGGNFGILGFLTTDSDGIKVGKEITPAERYRSYTSLDSVLGDWATSSEVAKAATSFYGQTPTPTDFDVIVNYRNPQKSVLLGGGTGTPSEIFEEAITWTGGEEILTLTLDGTLVELDANAAIAAAVSPITADSIADALTTEVALDLVGAKVTHNGYQYVVHGATAGASAGTITAAGDTEAARALGLTQASARVVAGINAETAVQSAANAAELGTEYVGLVNHKMFRDGAFTDDSGDSEMDIAAHVNGRSRIFLNTTNDTTTLVAGSSGCSAAKMKAKSYRFVLTTFSRDVNAYPSASVFGRAASVNFSAIGSTITLNLKQMPGITAEDLTPSEFANLQSYNASAVVRIGKSVNAFTNARMASGTWLDSTHGLMWLENRCEVDQFNLLYGSATKVPYSDTGLNMAFDVLTRSLKAAVSNGLAAPGYLPSGEFLSEGFEVYKVPLADVPASDKSNRVYKGLSFKMVGAGALQDLEVSGEFSE